MPILAYLVSHLLPPLLAGGLIVASVVPCTLASAAVWTRKAGGEDSIAMMTTVVTNVGCIAIVPLGIQMVLALQARVARHPGRTEASDLLILLVEQVVEAAERLPAGCQLVAAAGIVKAKEMGLDSEKLGNQLAEAIQ